MSELELEQVLRNWIHEALSSSGQLGEGIDPAKWVADNFVSWWKRQVGETLDDAESAAERLAVELKRFEPSKKLSGAFHELRHIEELLDDLRQNIGVPVEPMDY